MRQYSFLFKDAAGFIEEIRRTGEELSSPRVLFRIYSEGPDTCLLEEAVKTVKENFPEAFYVGAVSVGNIIGGRLREPGVAVTVTIMEAESTSLEVLQIPLADFPGRIVSEICSKDPGIRAVEFLITTAGLSGQPQPVRRPHGQDVHQAAARDLYRRREMRTRRYRRTTRPGGTVLHAAARYLA